MGGTLAPSQCVVSGTTVSIPHNGVVYPLLIEVYTCTESPVKDEHLGRVSTPTVTVIALWATEAIHEECGCSTLVHLQLCHHSNTHAGKLVMQTLHKHPVNHISLIKAGIHNI